MSKNRLSISKQEMYEEAIMKTYRHCLGPEVKREMKLLKTVPETFSELMIRRSLLGFKDRMIPRTHPFDTLGFGYLEQLFGMALRIRDFDFTNHLFDFVEDNTEYFDFKSQDQFDILYDFYWQSSTSYRDFFELMGDFILKNYDKSLEYYKEAVSIAYGLSGVKSLGLRELVKIKNSLS